MGHIVALTTLQELSALLVQEGRFNKAERILADPLQSLRLELCQEYGDNLGTRDSYAAAVDKIRALIPHYYEGKEQEEVQQAFDREVIRAQHAVATGTSLKAKIDGKTDMNGPNLYTPERMLLWYVTLEHLQQYTPQEGERENPGYRKIADELAASKGAVYLLDKFSSHVTPILGALGVNKSDCMIQWGEPDSHFWFRRKDAETDHNLINFDI